MSEQNEQSREPQDVRILPSKTVLYVAKSMAVMAAAMDQLAMQLEIVEDKQSFLRQIKLRSAVQSLQNYDPEQARKDLHDIATSVQKVLGALLDKSALPLMAQSIDEIVELTALADGTEASASQNRDP